MADFVPIVQGLGGNKICGLCEKPVSLGDTTRQTNMAADGVTLTSYPPLHMHSGCLREALLWVAAQIKRQAEVVTKGIVRDDAGNITAVTEITAEDAPGLYTLTATGEGKPGSAHGLKIRFQTGAVGEVGPNGITVESLIAVALDRLMTFQRGDLPCRENQEALSHLQQAMAALNRRTRDRADRGVEGTMRE